MNKKNKGKYFATTGEFILNDGQNVEEDYISIIKKKEQIYSFFIHI